MRAEIIAIGSELLTPDRTDTNSLFLTARLNRLGIEVSRKTIVGDQHDDLRDAFRGALDRVELVVTSGGLGPTLDDLTREALADLLGRKLVPNAAVLQKLEDRFRRFGRAMPEVNKRQALVIEGAEVLENPRGTAPGLWLEAGGRIVVLLPGPPHELEALFVEKVEPRLERVAGSTRLHARELRTVGLTESELEQRIAPIYSSYGAAQTTVLAALGEIQVHLRVWSADSPAAELLLDEMTARITAALGESVFTTTDESLEAIVARWLTSRAATLAAAESCTGGLVAQRLTRIPGSSAYFLGGVVCYSNALKIALAGVPAALIEAHGAVSSEVARALAEGIRLRTGATLGLGITGIAGPGGGSPEKPVGTVHIALAAAGSTTDHSFRFPGDRERVRWWASQNALDMIRRYFISQPGLSQPGLPSPDASHALNAPPNTAKNTTKNTKRSGR